MLNLKNIGAVRLISLPVQIHDTLFNGFLEKMRQKRNYADAERLEYTTGKMLEE